jgi:hypothetical protein
MVECYSPIECVPGDPAQAQSPAGAPRIHRVFKPPGAPACACRPTRPGCWYKTPASLSGTRREDPAQWSGTKEKGWIYNSFLIFSSSLVFVGLCWLPCSSGTSFNPIYPDKSTTGVPVSSAFRRVSENLSEGPKMAICYSSLGHLSST